MSPTLFSACGIPIPRFPDNVGSKESFTSSIHACICSAMLTGMPS